MSLAQDLLEQAQFLASREKKKPKQASLRRAVSTAYYAAFHLLSSEAAKQASPGSPSGLREVTQRSANHKDMKDAAKAFRAHNALPNQLKSMVPNPLPPPLVEVATLFVQLQEERHEADYNLTVPFDRARAQNVVGLASRLFSQWKAIRNKDEGRVFLASLLFGNRWSR
jgi:hypothetical protein